MPPIFLFTPSVFSAFKGRFVEFIVYFSTFARKFFIENQFRYQI